MTFGQFALQLLPALLVAIMAIYFQRWAQRSDKWRDEAEKKLEFHGKEIVRLDTSVTFLREHIEQMREDVIQTRRLVERLWGVVDGNPTVLDRFRKN